MNGSELCILHQPVEEKDPGEFLAALRTKIQQDQQDPARAHIHLEGVVFPPDFAWREAARDLKLGKGLNFLGATFGGDADFLLATFSGDATFRGATFGGDAGFRGATFGGNADFEHATFSGDADFWSATFGGGASFQSATFSGNANFLGATFGGDADFREATFSGNADFLHATFSGDADFPHATFSGDARFWGATFSGNADFLGATFGGDADFRFATFAQVLSFRQATLPSTPPADFDFSDVRLERPEQVSFERVSLERASFLRTDLSRVRFTGVITWPQRQEKLWGLPLPRVRIALTVLHDHLALDGETEGGGPERPTPRLVADTYRQLRLNLEATRQEIEARHFFIGQMDMRLRDPEIESWHKRLLWLYRQVALYGESYLRPFLLYGLLNVGFAFLYLLSGFTWEGDPIRYSVAWGWPAWRDLGVAWYVALTAGPLFQHGPVAASAWGLLAQVLNAFLNVLLLAIVVIALRRQFRR